MTEIQRSNRTRASNGRVILAFVFDLFTSFFIIGYLIALIFGGTTNNGFRLNGLPALLCFALIIAYFIIGNRTGGTFWKRIFKVPVG